MAMSSKPPIEELLDSLPEGWDDPSSRRSPGMLGVAVVNWRTLPDSEAPQVWTDLGAWVSWFIHRYNLPARKIPPCWFKHGALVEELSALHTAWLVSYDSLDAGFGPIGWHERLAVAIPRLATWYNGECHNGHTELPNSAEAVAPGWRDWITQSHAT